MRLHIVTEGQTEEGFVKAVLAPELGSHSVFADARSITTGRKHGHRYRGGMTSYEHLARDLTLWMKEDQKEDSCFTTMIDLYGLPTSFPGYESLPTTGDPCARVSHLEEKLLTDIKVRLKDLPVSQRLIPYIQLHEFEALLFSDTRGFADVFPDEPHAVASLTSVRASFHGPEDINNNPHSAPSKRILKVLRDYQKPVHGLLIAQKIGLAVIRRECPHFDNWFTRLVALGT